MSFTHLVQMTLLIYVFIFYKFVFTRNDTTSYKTSCSNTQQRHSTPIRPCTRVFEQYNNPLISASVPSNSFGNTITSGLASATCWGSLDENNTNSWSQIPSYRLHEKGKKSNLNDSHHQQTIKKENLIKFFEKKAAELVAHTVDTAANRCRIHLLWQRFSSQHTDQPVNVIKFLLIMGV